MSTPSRGLFDLLVREAGDPVYVFDADDGRIVDASRSVRDGLGYTSDEIRRLTIHSLDPDLSPELSRTVMTRLRRQRSLTLERHHRRRDGTRFPVELRLYLMEDGTRSYVLAVTRDITARREAERRRDALERVLDAIREVQSLYIGRASRHDAFSGMLHRLRVLTRSDAGALYELPVGRGRTLELRAASGLDGLGGLEDGTSPPEGLLSSLLDESLERRACVPHPEPEKAAAADDPGLPPWSVAIPLIHGDRPVGAIWLGRRETPFDHGGIDDVLPYIATCANILASHRDEVIRERAEAVLHQIVEETGPQVGDAFLRSLVSTMAELSGARVAFVAESSSEGARIRAIWVDGSPGDPDRFPLGAVSAMLLCGADGRAELDPSLELPEAWVRERRLSSVCGRTVADSRGRCIGHVALLHDRPIDDALPVEPVLKLLAARTGAELERERATRAARASDERYRRYFEEDLSGFYVTTASGRLTACNAAFAALLGFEDEDDACATPIDQIYPTPEARAAFLDELNRNQGRLVQFEHVLRRRNGSPLHVIENAVASHDDDGRLVDITGYLIDATESKRLEEQLRQSQKMDALGKLAGGIAHDFNNRLTVISGYGSMLHDELADPRLSRMVGSILEQSDRAADLTRQLLAFSRNQVLEPRVVDLNDEVARFETLLPRLLGEDIGVRTRLEDEPAKVRVDPARLEQGLLNLALNARDAMPEGGRLILSTTVAVRDGNPEVVLRVEDTGSGIDTATLGHIFEPFFTTKERGKGTGLGLATTYGIIKQSGGDIQVESMPGVGSIFVIRLPYVDAPLSTESREERLRPIRGSGTLLAVEDEPELRRLLREILEPTGYRVLLASDGREALELAGRHDDTIDLLLTDVIMPGISGVELARQLRCSRPDLKVLMMSGYTADAIRSTDRIDAESWLTKPFGPRELLERVRQAIDRTD